MYLYSVGKVIKGASQNGDHTAGRGEQKRFSSESN